MDSFEITVKDFQIFVKASLLNAEGADRIVSSMKEDNIYTLDFQDVEDINFAALRKLLNCRKSGQKFNIMNATSKIAEKMEDTGVSTYINISRKPKHIDISGYEEFGGGFMSKTFNSPDGDSMVKVYGPRVPKWMVANEKVTARAVMVFGIPTPLVGSLYEDGENTVLDFERIEGKKSFSRIISEQPERLEEMTVKFAQMCRALHSTECDTSIFPDKTIFYKRAVLGCYEISEELKNKTLSFIDSVPKTTTCLHGDMQLSNVITTGKEDMWIDLADFSYGNPLFDIGMWYFLAKLNEEPRQMDIFHMTHKQLSDCWDIFVREYFDAKTPETAAEVESKVIKFAALHMIYLGVTYHFEPGMVEAIEQILA